MGLSQKQTVIILYASSAALGLCAIVLADSGPFSAIILVVSISVFIIAGAKYLSELNIGKSSNSTEKRLCFKLEPTEGVCKMDKLKVMTVFGTRPDAIKMAPLVKELEKNGKIESVVCVTGQHRQMLDQVLEVFDIKPDYDLNIMQSRQTLVGITIKALEGISDVLDKVKPDIVLVHGDTTTTFVGSLASFYKKISVGHVEAGLRTFDKYSPYPVEMNRKLTGSLADLHFCPTATNKKNLSNENISGSGIYITGNTVIDALATTVKEDYVFENKFLNELDYKKNRIIAVTAHRRENLGEPLRNIFRALKRIADKYEDVRIVDPVHLNPAVQEVAREILGDHPRVHLLEPIGMQDMHNLMSRSYMVMTDSGGLQEEAPALGKPVLVLRNETERPEAVEAGTVKLAGTDEEAVFNCAVKLLDDTNEYNRMAKAVNPYGDGKASERIVQALLYEFGLSDQKPEEFS
jgi:UDP-GlcNAc:undecaprenyl-phosphate GlcNAc-1-phosphate transferase